MNIYELLFILQLLVALAIFGVKIYNLFRVGQFYSLRAGFLLLFGYMVCWLTSMLIFFYNVDILIYSSFFFLESWMLPFHGMFILVEIFFSLRDKSVQTINSFQSKPR